MMKTHPEKTSALYKRLLSYAFNYKVYFAIGIFGFILFSAMETLLAMTVEFFMHALEGTTSKRLDFLPGHLTASIYFVPVMIVVVAFTRSIGTFLGNFYLSRVGLGVVNDLRKKVFAHMIFLPQSYFDNNNSGELVSLIIYNIQQVTESVTNAIKIMFRDGFLVLFLLGLLLYYNWLLTLVFFATAPLLAALIIFANRYFLRVSRKIQQAVGMVTHVATETFQGIKLVKSFRGEDYENQRFDRAADENLKYGVKFERVKALQTPVLHIIITVALAIIFLLVLLFWNDTPKAAVAYVAAAGLIAKPFRQLTTINSIILKGVAASETIFSTLDQAKENNSGTKVLEDVKGRIEFKDTVFNYDDGTQAIKGINLTVEPGQTLALVGESGSGKSTIANLLLRFYEASSGQITIDNIPINDIELGSLRKNVALVNQHSVLFNDTIRSNIAYGSDLENKSIEEIQTSANDASAVQFIESLQKGFDTLVGEAGDRLSGGQQQRITIARAILKDAPILVLDEATSALDNETEKKVQEGIENLQQGRTTIVIAHRLSTIESADKIAVLKDGKLVEFGDHQTLMSNGATYAELYRREYSG